MKKGVLAGMMLVFCVSAWGEKPRALTQEGLGGRELTVLAVHPLDDSLVLLGTDQGVLRLDEQGSSWRPFCETWTQAARVNQITFAVVREMTYVATDKGVYGISRGGGECAKVFERSDTAEMDCLSIGEADGDLQWVGTRKGLFVRDMETSGWTKITSPFGSDPVVSIYAVDGVVYAASPSDVYVSTDSGRSWNKVFNLYLAANSDAGELLDAALPLEVEADVFPIRYVTGSKGRPSRVFVATKQGVFVSRDTGKSWECLPRAGLDEAQLRYLAVEVSTGALLAVSKTGVYRSQKNGWANIFMSDDARQLAQRRGEILVSTSRNVQALTSRRPLNDGGSGGEGVSFCDEPSIQDVQEMAIRYAGVSNEKINSWQRAARLKALLPKFSYDRDKTVTTALGASYDKTQVGPLDWGISLSWDFSDLVYSESQTSIDSRAKLMVDQRNDILSEVTRLYFERRKIQIEIASEQKMSEAEMNSKRLRLMELTALIDRLTGGTYSKLLKSID